MIRTIELLQSNGTDLRTLYSENLENGIFELRAKIGSDISRALYFFYIENKQFLRMDSSRKRKRRQWLKLREQNGIAMTTSRESSQYND